MCWRLGLLLALLLAGCRAASPPDRAPERAVTVRQEAAQALYTRWHAALSSDRDPLELWATEEELTSLAALSLANSSVQGLVVWLTSQGARLRADLNLAGRHTLEAWLALGQADGVSQVVVEHVRLDGHPLPRLICLSIEQATNDALADASLPVTIEQLTLGEGSLYILAHPR
jgi:hypothetical protein